MKRTRIALIILVMITGVTVFHSCYYDNELYLYGAECDNSVITYTARIKGITDRNCAVSGCHAGPSPSGNISFEGYDNVRASTENTSVICTINHADGCLPMPQNRPQLSQCDIDAWEAWVAASYPN